MKTLGKKFTHLFLGLLTINQSFTINAMEKQTTTPLNDIIYIQFSDQKIPTMVPESFAVQFATINNALTDLGTETSPKNPLPLHNITSNTWNIIEALLLTTKSAKDIDIKDLKNIILALNYLDPKSPEAKKLFNNAQQKYIDKIINKAQIETNDFFKNSDLDKMLINELINHVIKPNTLKLHTITNISYPTLRLRNKNELIIACSPDGKTLAMSFLDNSEFNRNKRDINIWNLSNPQEPQHVVIPNEIPLNNFVFSPNGKILAITEKRNNIILLDTSEPPSLLESWGILYKTAMARLSGVGPIAFSPDSKTFASVSENNTIKLWNLSHPQQPHNIANLDTNTKEDKDKNGTIKIITFSPNGKTVAVAYQNSTTQLWDLSNPKKTPLKITEFTSLKPDFQKKKAWIHAIAFGHDTQNIAAVSKSGTVALWHFSNDQTDTKVEGYYEVKNSEQEFSQSKASIFTPNNNLALINSWGKKIIIKLWNPSHLQKPYTISLPLQDEYTIPSITFNPNNTSIFAAGFKLKEYHPGKITLWKLLYLNEITTLLNYLKNTTKINEQFIQNFVLLLNMIKNLSQRTDVNYDQLPDSIKETVKTLFPPTPKTPAEGEGIWQYIAPLWQWLQDWQQKQ